MDKKTVDANTATNDSAAARAQQELAGILYAVSHDLRAPLRAITGFAQALQEHAGSSLDETAQRYLQRIQQSNQKLSQLLDALLALSRITQEELRCQEIDLSQLCRELASALETRYPQQRVQLDIQPEMQVHADPQLFKSALEQLLDNAWKATAAAAEPHIVVTCAHLSGKAIVSVQDNGLGFDMLYTEKLFIPFQHLHAAVYNNGLGIGLASVQRIVTKHNGRVWADAKPQQGAIFRIELPD